MKIKSMKEVKIKYICTKKMHETLYTKLLLFNLFQSQAFCYNYQLKLNWECNQLFSVYFMFSYILDWMKKNFNID